MPSALAGEAVAGESADRSGVIRSEPRDGKQRVWLLVCAATLMVVAAPLVAFTTYLHAAAQIPDWNPTGAGAPSPNGYSDFLAAGAQISNKAQGQVLRGKLGTTAYRSILAEHRDALQRVRQGLTRECRVPIDPTYRGLVELDQFRALTRLLIAEGDLAAASGRYDAAVESYLDAIRFGTEMPRGGGLVYSYRGLSFQEQGLQALDRILEHLDAAARSRLTADLAALDRRCVRAPEAVDRQTEITTALLTGLLRHPDPLQEASRQVSITPTSPFPPLPPPTGWRESWEVRLTPRSGVIRGLRAYMAQVTRDLEQPYYRRPGPRPLPKDPFSRSWIEGSERFTTVAAWEHRDFNWRKLTTRLAIERYRSRQGTLPATLKELAPEYLPDEPQDPFAPHPLIYRRQGSRYRLYSRGPDGDDDGGRDLPGYVERGQDGDLVTLRNR